MPLHINVCCDNCNKVAQGMKFEHENETLGDLVNAYVEMGWTVEGAQFICPTCVKAQAAGPCQG